MLEHTRGSCNSLGHDTGTFSTNGPTGSPAGPEPVGVPALLFAGVEALLGGHEKEEPGLGKP